AGPGGGHHGGGHSSGGHHSGGYHGGGRPAYHAPSYHGPVRVTGGNFHPTGPRVISTGTGPRVISTGFVPSHGRVVRVSGTALPNSAFVRSLHTHPGRSRSLFFFGFGSPFGLYG